MTNPHRKTTVFQHNGNQGHELLGMIRDPARLIVNQISVWCQTVIVRADLVRSVGGFDPFLRCSEDRDFLFRAALVSTFCYVGMPMVLIDRSPAELRHMGEAKNWDREEFRLRMDQYRVEKQLSLGGELDSDIRKSIRRNVRDIHSQWADLYLEKGEFRKAGEALSTAMGSCPGLEIPLKWVLTRLAPELAKKVIEVRRRHKDHRCDVSSWETERKKPLETATSGLTFPSG